MGSNFSLGHYELEFRKDFVDAGELSFVPIVTAIQFPGSQEVEEIEETFNVEVGDPERERKLR